MPKHFIALITLAVLISACRGQASTPAPVEDVPFVLSYTQETPLATSTPLIIMATEAQASQPVTNINTTPALQTCPGTPMPHVVIGQQAIVMVEDFDKLKLRSAPAISPDTEIVELDKFTQLKIVEGPVCVTDAETDDSYWFWKVSMQPGTDIGWVAEGDLLHYDIE